MQKGWAYYRYEHYVSQVLAQILEKSIPTSFYMQYTHFLLRMPDLIVAGYRETMLCCQVPVPWL
jgi:hypothetical protein